MITQDLVFCFSCCKAAKEGMVRLTVLKKKISLLKDFVTGKMQQDN